MEKIRARREDLKEKLAQVEENMKAATVSTFP
jgi:hypothetical protein